MIDITIAVPVVVALVEAFKRAGLDTRYAPIVSIVLGMAGFYLFGVGEMAPRLFEGLLTGLASSGLYSTGRSVLK